MVMKSQQPLDLHSPAPKNGIAGLTLKQQKAIVALLQEPTVAKAAKSAGVGRRTIFEWFDDETFGRAYRKARRDAFGQAIGLCQKYAPLAVSTLTQIMASPDSPAHTRVSAASTLLRFGREGIELDDLAARVEALEEAAEMGVGRVR